MPEPRHRNGLIGQAFDPRGNALRDARAPGAEACAPHDSGGCAVLAEGSLLSRANEVLLPP